MLVSGKEMSRGFVKEDDSDQAGDVQLERPQSPYPNYVTPTGLKLLQEEAARLADERSYWLARKNEPLTAQKLAKTELDLRYVNGRIERAILVDPKNQPADRVLFGAIVTVEDEEGSTQEFSIVGEEEADIASNKVSWVSPLARALIGAQVGSVVKWQRPAGDKELEVVAIRYPE